LYFHETFRIISPQFLAIICNFALTENLFFVVDGGSETFVDAETADALQLFRRPTFSQKLAMTLVQLGLQIVWNVRHIFALLCLQATTFFKFWWQWGQIIFNNKRYATYRIF